MGLALTNQRPVERRPHVHELDRLRVETALSVVIVHVLMFTTTVEHAALGSQVQGGFVAIFHFTRELFMFVTGLALVYVYFGKPFNLSYFWKRRGIGVLMPYILWSVIYTIVNTQGLPWPWVLVATLYNVATGNASYQLYYILLMLEFYLLLPVFLAFLARVRHRPWLVLGISFALQVLEFIVDYRFISGPGVKQTPMIQSIAFVQLRFVLTYQFFFVLGGMVALHLDTVRAFLAKHGRWMLLVGVGAFGANVAVYVFDVFVRNVSIGAATSAYHPIMAVYCTGLIAALGYLAYRSVQRSPAGVDPRKPRSRWWALLADASFGIYLVHALVLTSAQMWVLPRISSLSPWITLTAVCVLTCATSVAITIALMCIPVLSRTVGREHPVALLRGAGQKVQRAEAQAGRLA